MQTISRISLNEEKSLNSIMQQQCSESSSVRIKTARRSFLLMFLYFHRRSNRR